MLQKQVYIVPAKGQNGQPADWNAATPIEHTPQMRAAVAGIKIGSFVWRGTAPAGSGLEMQSQAWATNTGSGVPEGFVYLNRSMNLPVDASASYAIDLNKYVPVAVSGAFYVSAATAPTVGQKVFAKLADGTLLYGAAGATVSGGVETKWAVKAVDGQQDGSGTAGYLVTISDK